MSGLLEVDMRYQLAAAADSDFAMLCQQLHGDLAPMRGPSDRTWEASAATALALATWATLLTTVCLEEFARQAVPGTGRCRPCHWARWLSADRARLMAAQRCLPDRNALTLADSVTRLA